MRSAIARLRFLTTNLHPLDTTIYFMRRISAKISVHSSTTTSKRRHFDPSQAHSIKL